MNKVRKETVDYRKVLGDPQTRDAVLEKIQSDERTKQLFEGFSEHLQEEIIPLDIFKEIPHNEISKLDAWLYFLSSDDPRDISRVVESYPEFKELYAELIMLRYRVKELIEMYDVYREALRVADENTVKYMIEEQKKEIEEQKKVMKEQESLMKEQEKVLEEQKQTMEEQKQTMEEQKQTMEEQKQTMEEQNSKLEEQNSKLEEQQKEIERLRKLLQEK